MTDKKIRRLYLAAKALLLAVAALSMLGGCHYINVDGYEAAAAICWMLGGMLSMLFAVLEE